VLTLLSVISSLITLIILITPHHAGIYAVQGYFGHADFEP